MIQLSGQYNLNLNIGGVDLVVDPSFIREFVISQDVDQMFPSFRISILDPSGNLGLMHPYDHALNTLRIDLARTDSANFNSFHFTVKSRDYVGEVYRTEGILDVPDAISPGHSRALKGNVRNSIIKIASEMKVKHSIGSSLNYDKTLLQPSWSNFDMLTYLKNNLPGRLGEGRYYAFIKNQKGDATLVVKSLNELYGAKIQRKYVIGTSPMFDYEQAFTYELNDDSSWLSDLAGNRYRYDYFDYDTGQCVDLEISSRDCPILGTDLLVDSNKDSQTNMHTVTGRGNDFTADFAGHARGKYFGKFADAITMTITVPGDENAVPGDIVLVLFAEDMEREGAFTNQHVGRWMVRHVDQILGKQYITRLVLSRTGVDTQYETSLMGKT